MKRSIHGKRIGKSALRALALSAVLLAAPAAVLADSPYSGKIADKHDGIVAGGAIYAPSDITFTSADQDLEINSNYAGSQGTAIKTYGAGFYAKGQISLTGFKTVTIDSNTAAAINTSGGVDSYGGALFSESMVKLVAKDEISIENNKTISRVGYVSQNQGTFAYGGAIYAESISLDVTDGTLTINHNSASADYNESAAQAYGGALYSRSGVQLAGTKGITIEFSLRGNQACKLGVAPYMLKIR